LSSPDLQLLLLLLLFSRLLPSYSFFFFLVLSLFLPPTELDPLTGAHEGERGEKGVEEGARPGGRERNGTSA